MYSAPHRHTQLQHLATAVVLLGSVGGAVMVGWGGIRWNTPHGLWLMVAGGAVILASVAVHVLLRVTLKVEGHAARLQSQVFELQEALQKVAAAMERVAENTSISETTKSIAHRDRERDALRGAVFEEVRREDFDAAFHLIDALETRLGYRDDAEKLRVEIRDACTEAFKAKLKQVIIHVHSLMEKRRWQQAQSEIDRLEKVMPNDQRVAELWTALERKRAAYKSKLISDWREEVAKSNIERCMEILKELDPYLEREEARQLESQAREVFKERLQQLAVQFQFAVREHRWQDALVSGLQITEEFPNSRMAREVQEHLGPLRARAGIPTDFEVTARPD